MSIKSIFMALVILIGLGRGAVAGFLDNGGWVVDGEPEPLPPPVGLSSNSIDPVTDAVYRAVPSWAEVLGIGAVSDRDIGMGGHSITGVASVAVSNTVDAGAFSASGTVGRTSAARGFKAGLMTDTNAFDTYMAGISAAVSGTDKVTKAYVDAGDVAATNAANVLAMQKFTPLSSAVTNGGDATLGTVSVTSMTIGGNPPLTNSSGSASLVFYVSKITQAVDVLNTDTGAVPNEVYGINLKSSGSTHFKWGS